MNLGKVLVLGASGLVGRYLYDYLKKQNIEAVGTFFEKRQKGMVYFDISKSSINELNLSGISHAVICSAITKLDVCRNKPELSQKINVEATKKIISELSQKGITPVFISSASVFDGVRGGYKEAELAERNPTNLYGKQKFEIENFIFSDIGDYLIIRPGKVFGLKKDEGVLFSHWLDLYKKKAEIKLADDEELSPVYAGDIARAITLLMKSNEKGLWHINPPYHLSRYDLALDFFNYLEIPDAKIIRCSIDDLGLLEKRAKKTYLDASKLITAKRFEFTNLNELYEKINKQSIKTTSIT